MGTMSRRRPQQARPPQPVAAPAQALPGLRSPGRAVRLRAVLERDGSRCIWCARPFGDLVPPTTEHVVPRLKGGPSWLENEVAACRRCNSGRGHRGPVEWLEECRRRGWDPDEDRLARALTGLGDAIARRGGQRRARPYLAAQLRRLRRRTGAGTRDDGDASWHSVGT